MNWRVHYHLRGELVTVSLNISYSVVCQPSQYLGLQWGESCHLLGGEAKRRRRQLSKRNEKVNLQRPITEIWNLVGNDLKMVKLGTFSQRSGDKEMCMHDLKITRSSISLSVECRLTSAFEAVRKGQAHGAQTKGLAARHSVDHHTTNVTVFEFCTVSADATALCFHWGSPCHQRDLSIH